MATTVSTVERQSSTGIWTRPTVSWMLYDLANTIFAFAIMTFYFSPWFVGQAGGNDAILSYAITVPMFIMLVAGPVLGALSDQTPRRMPLLIASTLICVVFTTLLGIGGLVVTLVFFAIANFCFQASQIFYDALLPVVSTEANRGRVSGYGVGVGYLGSFIMLGAGSLILASGGSPIDIFRTTGLLFLLFALPCFLFVREQPRRDVAGFSAETVAAALRALRQTAQRVGDYDGLRRFLLSRALYNDVANTLATFMVVYAEQELAFTKEDVTIVGACTILASIAGGLFWGSVIDRMGPKRTLTIVLVLWMVTLLLGVLIPVLALPKASFFIVGSLIGVTLAGTWASDRTLLLRLAPPRFLGQFYGLYAMVGRFGQIIGPLLWGFIAVTLGLGRPVALASLIIIVAVAFVILRPVSDARREWRTDERVEGQ